MGSSVDARNELLRAHRVPSLVHRSSFTHLHVLLASSTVGMRVTAIAALAVFLIVVEAPLRELLRAGRYRALRANLKPHAPPLNLSRVLEVAVADRCVGDGRCAGDELHDFAAAKGRMARVQAALNSPAKDRKST